MGLYDRYLLPRLLALAMRNRELVPYRSRVVARATGRVLEIGMGSALNLPFYGANVREIVGLEPSPVLAGMARSRRPDLPFQITVVEGHGERMPLESGSIDTVVTTWTLCSVADPVQVLREARRVLRPSGELLFAEHGRSPDSDVIPAALWADSNVSWSGSSLPDSLR